MFNICYCNCPTKYRTAYLFVDVQIGDDGVLLIQHHIEHLQVLRTEVHLAELEQQHVLAVLGHRQIVAKRRRVIALRLVQILVRRVSDAADRQQLAAVIGGGSDAAVRLGELRIAFVADAVLVDVLLAARIDGVHHLVGFPGGGGGHRRPAGGRDGWRRGRSDRSSGRGYWRLGRGYRRLSRGHRWSNDDRRRRRGSGGCGGGHQQLHERQHEKGQKRHSISVGGHHDGMK